MSLTKIFKEVLDYEADVLKKASRESYPDLDKILNLLLNVKGKVVISGLGKSGHIGKKIAASLSSTGTPAVFMHATEGLHGDLGLIQRDDVVILISNSGETIEVTSLIATINKIGSKTIAITAKEESKLAKECHFKIIYNYGHESDHLNLAPTASTTLVLAIGDAIAITLSKHKNFKKEDFHLYHPGGSLGKSLKDDQ